MATFTLNTTERFIDRYDITKFSNPVDQKFAYFDIIDSDFLFKLRNLKKFETYTITIEEGRPELVSERIYGLGETQFWWIIMLLNELRLPQDLKRGMVIRYPTRNDLEDIYLGLGNKPTNGLKSIGGNNPTHKERIM